MRRKQLRANMSVSEKVLCEAIRKRRLGYQFKRQVSVGRCTLDFYCPEASLNIELDGEQHADRRDQDAARDAFLASCGILVIRIPSLDLFEETGTVAAQWLLRLHELCEARSSAKRWSSDGPGAPSLPNPSPPAGGKGAR